MRIVTACPADMSPWLALAAEVEPLFGPMVRNPAFHRALRTHIGRGTAFCVRENDGPPGARLMGGLLFSSWRYKYEISWLAVAQRWRRGGVGRALIEHAFSLVESPAELVLVTFGTHVPGGQNARRFYEQLGFHPAESAPTNPAGLPCQVYRRTFGRTPTVRAVVQDEDRYLLVLHNNVIPEHIGKWGLPGGRIDPADPNRRASLHRELREEFQIEVDIERFINLYAYRDRLHYVYHVRPHSTDLVVDPGEILDHTWLTLAEVTAWAAAHRFHTGFELAAITASREPSNAL